MDSGIDDDDDDDDPDALADPVYHINIQVSYKCGSFVGTYF